jgi:hypothetical protein
LILLLHYLEQGRTLYDERAERMNARVGAGVRVPGSPAPDRSLTGAVALAVILARSAVDT